MLGMNPKHIVSILYTNWRGETRWRQVIPRGIVFAATQWHPEDQWLLEATEPGSEQVKHFALHFIHCWIGRELREALSTPPPSA